MSQGVGNDPLAQARLLAAQGRAPEAKSLLEAILQEEPTHERALLLLADLLLAAAREAEALAVYRRAASLHEQSAEAHTGLANCLHALHEDDAALEEAQAAHALLGTGDNARHAAAVYLTLVWCLREKRLLREALAAAEEGLARVNDAVLAQWASTVEEELAEAEKERC